MKLRKVLFTGSRDWVNPEPVVRELDFQRKLAEADGATLVVIHGGGRGLDTVVDKLCAKRGIHRARVDALWDASGRSAGPIRNSVMVALEPQLGVAFHPALDTSTGTKDAVQKMRAAGISVIEVQQ
jgi:sugar phosphate isomerase/epimerase